MIVSRIGYLPLVLLGPSPSRSARCYILNVMHIHFRLIDFRLMCLVGSAGGHSKCGRACERHGGHTLCHEVHLRARRQHRCHHGHRYDHFPKAFISPDCEMQFKAWTNDPQMHENWQAWTK